MPRRIKPRKSLKIKTPLAYVLDELDREMSLEVDVPGVTYDNLSITVEGNEINVNGKRLGVPFGQRFKFNNLKYDPTTVDAELELGVLQITMDARPNPGVITVPVVALTGSVSSSV